MRPLALAAILAITGCTTTLRSDTPGAYGVRGADERVELPAEMESDEAWTVCAPGYESAHVVRTHHKCGWLAAGMIALDVLSLPAIVGIVYLPVHVYQLATDPGSFQAADGEITVSLQPVAR